MTLELAWTCSGTELGPDGKPLPGVQGFGLSGWRLWEPVKTAELTKRAFDPRRPDNLLFQHSEKGLVGVAQRPKEN